MTSHNHSWDVIKRTFAEPDDALATQLANELMLGPVVFYAAGRLCPGEVQYGGIVAIQDLRSGESIQDLVYVPDMLRAYERLKHGVTSFVMTCSCGETRVHEVLGKE